MSLEIYTANNEVLSRLNQYTPTFRLKSRDELDNVLGKKPCVIVGGDGYEHHETIKLVEKIGPDPITYMHIDGHIDRFGHFNADRDTPKYENFTFAISELPFVQEIIYIGADTRLMVLSDKLADLLNHCRIYGTSMPSQYSDPKIFGREKPFFPVLERVIAEDAGQEYVPPKLIPEIESALSSNPSIREYKFGNVGLTAFGLMIFWKGISEFNPQTIKTDRVYISTDVDVLREEEGIPIGEKFSRGTMKLADLVRIIELTKEVRDIVALDVHGINLIQGNRNQQVENVLLKITSSMN